MPTLESSCTFLNHDDEIMVRQGIIGAVRSMTVEKTRIEGRNALSVLPRTWALALGASFCRWVAVGTPTGLKVGQICDNIAFRVEGRQSTLPCVALEGPEEVVLGRTAMLALGLEITADGTAVLNPEPYLHV